MVLCHTAATMAPIEEGFVLNCSLCDSYFVLVTGSFDPAAWRGRGGSAALDEHNARKQEEWERRRHTLQRCPTCVELVSGLQFTDWMEQNMRDTELETPLSPCRPVSFADGEPPALYVDRRVPGGGKAKWGLASGVGPAGLELDSSRSGRLWKPSLRPAGIDAARYDGGGRDAAWHYETLLAIDLAIHSLPAELASALADRLCDLRPAFAPDSWGQVAADVCAAASDASDARAADERALRAEWSAKRMEQELRGVFSRTAL